MGTGPSGPYGASLRCADNARTPSPAAAYGGPSLTRTDARAARRSTWRIPLLLVLVLGGLALIAWLWVRNGTVAEETALAPMDVEWADDRGYATLADGRLVELRLDGDRVAATTIAEGLEYPRGLAVTDAAIYVVELGSLPCEEGTLRCKGEHVNADVQQGEQELLSTSAGRIVRFPLGGGSPSLVLEDLPFVNTDHGLNDLEVGPDGDLYLSIGNLDRLAWDDAVDPTEGPELELIGSVLRVDPETADFTVFARGFRNVYGLGFDEDGTLWGVDNDGPGRGSWRFEELVRIEEGLDYGFPDEGTVGPYRRRTGFATWIMPSGAGSSGIHVADGTVLSGGCGRVTRLRLEPDGGDADLQEAEHRGCVTAIAALPDGRLLLGTVLGSAAWTVTTEAALFGD